MKLLGVVVLFNPDESVWDNIRTYIDEVDELILWLNSSIESIPILSNKQIIMGNGENVGIGKALNEAVLYAMKNGYSHILTMDQDSSFDDFAGYREIISQYTKEDVGCFCPNSGWKTSAQKDEDCLYSKMGNAITSGSVYPLSIFEKVGLFRDDFFIDAIDTEFNYRLRTHKYNIWGVGSISMRHKLGNKTTFKLFFFHFRNVNYPPIRIYYVLRNHTIVNRLYPHYFDAFNFYRFFLFRRLCQVLLYEPDKRKKLKAMFYGLIHGWKGKTGVCTIFE